MIQTPEPASGIEPAEDAEFRTEVREWLAENLNGQFRELRGLGGPGREHEAFEERLEWDRALAAAGLTCLGWPEEWGGRDATLRQQVIFHEEYAKADAPSRVSHLGEELLGPTVIAFGTEEQKRRFLPGIRNVTELWCQGYSEPGAGSDLAAVTTSAHLDGDEWVINGQKIWTSLAHLSDWCFVVARTEKGSSRHHGLSYLLVPMKQPGVEVRPIIQLTGTAEFNEVFFDNARTAADLVVGQPGEGGRSRWARSPSSAASPPSASRSATRVSSPTSKRSPARTARSRTRSSPIASTRRGSACGCCARTCFAPSSPVTTEPPWMPAPPPGRRR